MFFRLGFLGSIKGVSFGCDVLLLGNVGVGGDVGGVEFGRVGIGGGDGGGVFFDFLLFKCGGDGGGVDLGRFGSGGGDGGNFL